MSRWVLVDDIDKDCIKRWEYFLGRKLIDYDEYRKIDGIIEEMILEWGDRDELFRRYPELHKYTNKTIIYKGGM